MSVLAVVAIGLPDDEALASVEGAVAAAFGREVARLAPLPEPERAFDASRGQWSAPEMLKALLAARPASAERILGVTGRDLFIPVLSFVFGQARCDCLGTRAHPLKTKFQCLQSAMDEPGLEGAGY